MEKQIINKEENIVSISNIGAIICVTASKVLSRNLNTANGIQQNQYDNSRYTSIVDNSEIKYLLLNHLEHITY